jgi:hypothetical protein
VSLQSFKTVRFYTKFLIFAVCFFGQVQVKAWDVDFSRRTKELKSARTPASIVDESGAKNTVSLKQMTQFFKNTEPAQEIVILNTESGFVPEKVNLKIGQNYKIHVVNVDSVKKNQSFILDSFSEHHATFFGERKTFEINSKVEGVFTFQAPESGRQGQLVIFSDGRKPASENE